MKTKAQSFLLKFKYETAAFLILAVQACINIDFYRGMDEKFYAYYLADLSMGKTSRLLIGSLVNLLTDHPTVIWINCFAAVVLVLTFIFTSILIGRLIKSAGDEMKPCVALFSLFFVSGAFTLYGFSKFFGMLDVYMYLLAVTSILIAKNKYLRWLIPVFCVAGVLINYGFTISFFVPIAVVLLYLVFTEEKKAGSIIVLLVSCAASLLVMLFCVFKGDQTATLTFEEMWRIMEQKIGMELNYDHVRYYDYYLFGNEEQEIVMGVELDEMTTVEFIKAYIEFMKGYSYNLNPIVSVAVGALPVIAFFWYLWMKCIKASETKIRKFVYVCFMLSTFSIVVCGITSTDLTRWTGAGIISQFFFGYYMFKIKDAPFEKAMLEMKELLKGKSVIVGVIWVIYASYMSIFSLTG